LPEAPESNGDQDEEACDGLNKLTASVKAADGTSIVWYDKDGNEVGDPSIVGVGSATFYAEAVDDETGCASADRTKVTLTLKDCTNGGNEFFCQGEQTAYGGSNGKDVDQNGAWWYYFDTQGDAVQPIYAGQKLTNGTVTYDKVADKITIDLGDWSLQIGDETVKVLGYNTLPVSRPPNGGGPGSARFYAGTGLEIQGNGSRYYVIHLDVVCSE
jgi:VCBS repeat-containing protein